LRGWLDDDVEGQRLFRHLASAADAWDTMGRPDSELYRGARLSRTLEWRDRTNAELSDTETAFLAAAAALSESELRATRTRVVRERRVNRRLRGALAGVGVLLVLTLVAGAFAVRTADQAQRERDRAEAAAVLADARRAGAQALVHEDVATSLLLAVNALQVDDSPQAWENLGAALTRAGPLAGVRNVGSQVGRVGGAYIVSMATSADGALVAASLPVDGVQLFDAATLAPIAFEEDIPSSAVAFSPDGTQLAMAVNQWNPEGDPRIDSDPLRLYDMPSGELSEHQLGGIPADRVVEYALAFSRDGSRLTTVLQHHLSGERWARLGQATVWDLAQPSKPIFVEAVPDYALVSLSPDGERLYVATKGIRPLRMYDVDSGQLITSADRAVVGSSGPAAIDTSRDGSTLVVASGHRILQLDASTLQPRVRTLDGHSEGEVTDVSYSRNGQLLVSVATDGSAVVWDAHSGALLHRFVSHRSWFTGAAFGADDRTVYTTGADGFVQVWHLAGTHGLLTLGEATEETGNPYQLSLPAPDGQTVLRLRSGRLWFENTTTGRTTTPQPTEPVNFTWSPDSHWLLSSSADGALRVWDAQSGTLAARATGIDAGEVLVPAFSNDSDKVYVATLTSVVTGTEGLWLVALDRATLRPLYEDVYLGPGSVSAIFPRPRDRSVVAVKEDGSFWYVQPEERDVLGSEAVGLLSSQERPGVVSPDGSLMVAPDQEQNLRVLDLDTREWIGPNSHTLWGLDVDYAPDGSQFASVHPERIRLWDGHTGEYLASLPLPSATAEVTISYLPDSSGLLVASSDGRTWTVDTRTNSWVRRACDIASRNLTQEEWQQFFPNRPYVAACPQWPAGA
jgi:WD40 repeat protein